MYDYCGSSYCHHLEQWRLHWNWGWQFAALIYWSRRSNTTNTRNPTTIAFLINTTRINGVITVVSELQLKASELYPTSNVSCGINGRRLYGDTITFQTLPGKLAFPGIYASLPKYILFWFYLVHHLISWCNYNDGNTVK